MPVRAWPVEYRTMGDLRANRHRERLWLSPHCVRARQLDLFDGAAG